MIQTCSDVIQLDATDVHTVFPDRCDIGHYHELVVGIFEEGCALDGDVGIIAIEAANNLAVRPIDIGRINLHQQGVLTIKHDLVIIARRDKNLRHANFGLGEIAGSSNRVLGEDRAGNLIVDNGQFEEPHAAGTASGVVSTHDIHCAILGFAINSDSLCAIIVEVSGTLSGYPLDGIAVKVSPLV